MARTPHHTAAKDAWEEADQLTDFFYSADPADLSSEEEEVPGPDGNLQVIVSSGEDDGSDHSGTSS